MSFSASISLILSGRWKFAAASSSCFSLMAIGLRAGSVFLSFNGTAALGEMIFPFLFPFLFLLLLAIKPPQ